MRLNSSKRPMVKLHIYTHFLELSQRFCVIHGEICVTCIRWVVKPLVIIVKIFKDVSVCTFSLHDIRMTVTFICSVVYLCISIWMLLPHARDNHNDDYCHKTFTPLKSCSRILRFSFQAMLDEDEDERVDEPALQQLTEMGFPESRAIKALRLNQ